MVLKIAYSQRVDRSWLPGSLAYARPFGISLTRCRARWERVETLGSHYAASQRMAENWGRLSPE
jgi:hypothetical protein